MNKIYEVIHYYDEDGGFGDSVPVSDTVARFSDEKKAKEFVEKYAKPHAYEKPYAYLFCGTLRIREVEIDTCWSEENMWWLDNNVIELPDNWEDEDE